jgi:hypothetical protein
VQREVKHSEAIVAKYPEQIIIGIARDRYGKDKPNTLGWTARSACTRQ